MPELRERGARNHTANFGESVVVANAASGLSDPNPDIAILLNGASERTIVDQLAANGRDSSDARQSVGPNQDAAASRAHAPRRRIELEKEVDEGRNQRTLWECPALQFDHIGSQIQIVSFSARDQARDIVRCMHDVRIR